jgi:general secretion pathway protein G
VRCVVQLIVVPLRRMARLGFTVIELLVVLAAIALLLAVAAPRYVQHLDRAREVTLKSSLHALREAIDKFQADQSRPPASLAELVQRGYLRRVPVDPITERDDSWQVQAAASGAGGIADVRSGAPGAARDGSIYASW